jgi:beta-lactamase superfamily II metal-dependent hydrolase
LRTSFTIHKARHGDCILIRTFDTSQKEFIILIDGGPPQSYKEVLRDALAGIPAIDLLILTHIDSDHIGGFVKLLQSPSFKQLEVKRYWFNAKNLLNISVGTNISIGEAIAMEELIISHGIPTDRYTDIVCVENDIYQLADGITANIISPDNDILNELFADWPELSKSILDNAEDELVSAGEGVRMPGLTLKQLAELPFAPDRKVKDDIFNASSIAFVLELPDCKLLLLGDARPEILVAALQSKGYTTSNKLKVDYVKVSHHGSRNNTSCELLDLIDCQHFIISTNGGAAQHRHPDRDVIARIVYHPARDLGKPITIYFNYSIESMKERNRVVLKPADREEGNWLLVDDTTQFSS